MFAHRRSNMLSNWIFMSPPLVFAVVASVGAAVVVGFYFCVKRIGSLYCSCRRSNSRCMVFTSGCMSGSL